MICSVKKLTNKIKPTSLQVKYYSNLLGSANPNPPLSLSGLSYSQPLRRRVIPVNYFLLPPHLGDSKDRRTWGWVILGWTFRRRTISRSKEKFLLESRGIRSIVFLSLDSHLATRVLRHLHPSLSSIPTTVVYLPEFPTPSLSDFLR